MTFLSILTAQGCEEAAAGLWPSLTELTSLADRVLVYFYKGLAARGGVRSQGSLTSRKAEVWKTRHGGRSLRFTPAPSKAIWGSITIWEFSHYVERARALRRGLTLFAAASLSIAGRTQRLTSLFRAGLDSWRRPPTPRCAEDIHMALQRITEPLSPMHSSRMVSGDTGIMAEDGRRRDIVLR